MSQSRPVSRAVLSEPPARARRRHLYGLPGERTLLAWDRTALALLGNGALLVLRDAGSDPLRLSAAVVAALLAALCGVLARRRARDIRRDRRLRPPTTAVAALSLGTVVLCALELCAIARA